MSRDLPPPPADMKARLTHDGVEWVVRANLWPWHVGLGAAAVAIGVVAVVLGIPLLALASLLPVVFWGLVVAQRGGRSVMRVRERAITVDDVTLPIDELRVAKLVEPVQLEGGWALVLKADGEVVSFGEGQPVDHLEWMLRAVAEAGRLHGGREEVEGREYSFLRKPPEQLRALTDRER